MTWTVPSNITAGKIFVVQNNSPTSTSATPNATIREGSITGTVQAGVSGTLGGYTTSSGAIDFGGTGDQILIYQGTSGTSVGATFIYGFNNGQSNRYSANNTWFSSDIDYPGTSLTGPRVCYGLITVPIYLG
jgi:hypothetical protein